MPNLDLHLALLGRPIINLGDASLRDAIPEKMQALLCYLSLNPGLHERTTIAELLWGSEVKPKTIPQMLTSLRTDLTRMGEHLDGFILRTKKTITFNHNSVYWLDVANFEGYLAGDPTPDQLRRAMALYRGEFLEGFTPYDAPYFENWLLGERERLRELALQALALLVAHHVHQKAYQDGIAYAQQLLRLDPWREEAHRELMRLLALSGQRSAALEQFEKCQTILDVEFGVLPGLETIHLAQQIRDDLLRPQPAPAPPVPIIQPAPFLPPPDLPYFVNREWLLAQMAAAATATTSSRRLALIGMGGMGKTSLVVHLAHHLRDHFPDGVLWAEVSQDNTIGVIDRWAEAYGCDFRAVADEAGRAAALRDILQGKRALLVLDDVDRITKVRPLIPDNFPGTVILTTRNEEIAYHLKAATFYLEELATADGLTLLRRVVGEERVEAEDAAAQQLCTLLQNLPLALNIAAQRLALRHQMHLRDMVVRLQREKSRLTALDEQEQAVRASFLVSWRALDEKQKRTFALIGIFAGRSFTVDALTAIAAGDPYETEDHLFALNALSLVAFNADNRYRQHTLLAEFAREYLTDPQADQRLAAYYLAFAQQNGQDYDALRPEWENLMAGMKAAYEREMWETVLGYSEALTEAWFARGRYTEARQGYEWAVAAAVALQEPVQEARNLLQWGKATREQGSLTEARAHFMRSLILFQHHDDPQGLATAETLLATLMTENAQSADDFQEALWLLDASQTIYQQLGDDQGVADTLYRQARTYYFMGHYGKALRLAQTARQQQEQTQELHGLILTLRLLSQIALAPDIFDPQTSRTCRLRALELSELLQDQAEIAVSLSMASEIYLTEGNLTRAWHMLEKSLHILRQIGARRNIALTLLRQSLVREKSGDLPLALHLGLEGLTLCQSLDDPLLITNALDQVGNLWQQSGSQEQAHLLWEQGLTLAQSIDHPVYITLFTKRLTSSGV